MRYVDRPETGMGKAQKSLDNTGMYNSTAVKRYLSVTYKGICAYCEAEVEVSNYLEVEHFNPKSHYPLVELDIHNLHLACKRCNNTKLDVSKPILSPNYYLEDPNDSPVKWKTYSESELKNRMWYHGHLLFSQDGDDVAKNTIEVLSLNNEKKTKKRERLIESRLRVYSTALNSLKIILSAVGQLAEISQDTSYKSYEKLYDFIVSTTVGLSKDTLMSMMKHGAPYSQMIIDNFYGPLTNCLKMISALSAININSLPEEKIKLIISCVDGMKAKLVEC